MENKRNRIRGLNDILRNQLELLAEQSELEGDGGTLAALSHEMVNIYHALTTSESKAEVVNEDVTDNVEQIGGVRTESTHHPDPTNEKGRQTIDINKLLDEAGAWGQNPDIKQVEENCAKLLYEEFQKMTLQEFKQYFRNKVTLEKETKEVVIEFGFK